MAHRATSENLRTFGSVVADLRLAAGLTSGELASRIGVSQSTLSRVENGKREPRLEIMRQIAAVLPGVTEAIHKYLTEGEF